MNYYDCFKIEEDGKVVKIDFSELKKDDKFYLEHEGVRFVNDKGRGKFIASSYPYKSPNGGWTIDIY